MIISGGSQVNGSDIDSDNYWRRLRTANALRAAGQAIFLAINLFLALFLWLSTKQDRNPAGTLPSASWASFFRVDPEHGAADAAKRGGAYSCPTAAPSRVHARLGINAPLLILAIAWPPLIVRGVFGLLQALLPAINYAMPDVYDYDSATAALTLSGRFVALETVFAVLPEWIACCLLCLTMMTEEGNRRVRKEREASERAEEGKRERDEVGEDGDGDGATVVGGREGGMGVGGSSAGIEGEKARA